MLRYRKVLLWVSVIGVTGSLSGTIGYGLHLRSDGYRRSLERRLSERLGMSLSIGSVRPLSPKARRLSAVRVRSRRRDEEVFGCARAVWRSVRDVVEEARRGQPAGFGGGGTYALDLKDGWLVVGSRGWDRTDYREMLRTGLGHDFAALGIRRIGLTDIDLQWRQPGVTWSAERSRGLIEFDEAGQGWASLVAERLNGVAVDRPIEIAARFTPGALVRFQYVTLTVPEAPMSALKLDALVGGPVSRGKFLGSVTYRHQDNGAAVSVAGAVRGALLDELTVALPGGPYAGRVDVVVDEATFGADGLRMLRFSGGLNDLEPGQFAPVMASGRLVGRLDLRVHQAVYRYGRIEYFSAEGRATGVSLGPLTELVGGGRITGTLDVEIHSLLIVDDRLVLAEATVEAVPPAGSVGTIDRSVLSRVSRDTLGFDATALLPKSIERVEYVRAGARLALNRDTLRVRGTHGSDGRTILTVRLLGRDVGIVKGRERVFQVKDLVALVRERLGRLDAERLRSWLGLPVGAREDGD